MSCSQGAEHASYSRESASCTSNLQSTLTATLCGCHLAYAEVVQSGSSKTGCCCPSVACKCTKLQLFWAARFSRPFKSKSSQGQHAKTQKKKNFTCSMQLNGFGVGPAIDTKLRERSRSTSRWVYGAAICACKIANYWFDRVGSPSAKFCYVCT